MSSGSLEGRALALFSEALDQPSENRTDWVKTQIGEDKALLARVLKLLEADAEAPVDVLRTGGAGSDVASPAIPERVGPYRIDGLIGQGGMGAVYKASRAADDFDHVVAIKIIRPGVMARTLVERFERERQILATLNHPNIARLFDGGETAEGSPFIVMEHIEGEAITDWADGRGLSLDDRLWLFGDLCGAVRHAHQNLIIHRDLTPSNVLVTETGAVKLIDFGIAKPHSDDPVSPSDASPSLASLSFTPGFAAPERAAGAAPNTLSDIYSLGKLLDVLCRDQTPSTDLRAIIDRASAPEPDARYSSVDALMEDLEHLRTHQPVDARRGGATYRLGRFLRRWRFPVFAAAVGLVTLASAFAMTFLQYREAETARQEAATRFDEVRSVANYMLFDLYDKLSEVHGNTAALESISERSRQYLDALSQASGGDRGLALEAAIGYRRLSDVVGNPITGNLGNRDEAARLLTVAYDRLTELKQNNPNDPDVLRAFGDAAYSRSVFEYIVSDDSNASADFANIGVAAYDTLIANHDVSHKDELRRLLIGVYTARPLVWVERGEEAMQNFAALRGDIDRLVAAQPDDEATLVAEADFYSNYGEARSWHNYFAGGDPGEALPLLDLATEKFEALVARDDLVGDHRRSLGATWYKRGQVHSDMEHLDLGLADLKQAEELILALTLEDPDDVSIGAVLLTIRKQMVADLATVGRHQEALELSIVVLEEARRRVATDRDGVGYLVEMGNTLHIVAEAYHRAGDIERACATYVEARDNYLKAAEATPLSSGQIQLSVEPLEAVISQCETGNPEIQP